MELNSKKDPNQESLSTEPIEVSNIVRGLKNDIVSGDFIRFLNELDHRGTGGSSTTWETEEKVVVEAFRLLRYHVVRNQLSNPDVVVLTGEAWAKAIRGKFNAFRTSKQVAESALVTFLTLSTLEGNYRAMIVRRGGVECAIKALDAYGDDKRLCNLACGLILSLVAIEKDGLNANSYTDMMEDLIQKLVFLVTTSKCGSEIALRVLFRFTFHRKKVGGKSLSQIIVATLKQESKTILALWNVIRKKSQEPTVEAALFLLWRLSVPNDDLDTNDDCNRMNESNDVSLQIDTIVSTMNTFESIAIREASCGILANLVIRNKLPVEEAQRAVRAMQGFLHHHNDSSILDEGLATCALHAICNMLESPILQTSLFSENDSLAKIIVHLMREYPESEELVEFACLAISRAARHNPGMKETFMAVGAFEQVQSAFEEFVTSRGDNPSLDIKDACLCAFGSLTGCVSGAQAAQQTRLVEIFETLLAVETDRDFAMVLDVILSNIRSYSMKDPVSIKNETIVREQPQTFSTRMETATNESEVLSLIQAMIGIRKPQFEIAVGSNDAFLSLLSVMERFHASVQVQERACVLLAEIYFHLPLPGISTETKEGPRSPQNQIAALTAICSAMDTYMSHVGTQTSGCFAISNLVHHACKPECRLLDSQSIDTVIDLCFKTILTCFLIHESDMQVQKCAIPALTALISVATTHEFRSWASQSAQQLSSTLARYVSSPQIQILALTALTMLEDRHPSVQPDYRSSDITGLLTLSCGDHEDICTLSSTLVVSILRNNHAMMGQKVLECHGAIERIISMINAEERNSRIQTNGYLMLENLVTLHEDISDVIITLISIPTLLKEITSDCRRNASKAISSSKILSCALKRLDGHSFSNLRRIIEASLLDGLDLYLEDSAVESAILKVLCICCDRDDDFEGLLLEEPRIQTIINAMQLNLGSLDLQARGCELLSKLSVLSKGKDVIGRCGGIPALINALLAHNDSGEIQIQGLTALKNLATAAGNKPIIHETEGEMAVIYALWIHYCDPDVTSTALSALNNIAVDSVTRTVAKMKGEVLTIVIAALKSFPTNEAVQKNACFYVKTCSYLPENVNMMCNHSEELLPLLLRAGDAFPESCSDRVNAVVKKLTAR